MVPLLPNFEADFSRRWDCSRFMEHVNGIYEIIKPSNHYRNVLSHQDLWTSNILFQKPSLTSSSIHAKLIDFQCMRYLPPAADFMQLLHLTTRRAEREENFTEYLNIYYKSLSRHLSDYGLDSNLLLPFTEFQSTCCIWRFLALINACILLPWIHMPEDSLHNLKITNLKQYEQMAYVRRVDYIVEIMQGDREYKEFVEEIICELVEWVYEQKTYIQ